MHQWAVPGFFLRIQKTSYDTRSVFFLENHRGTDFSKLELKTAHLLYLFFFFSPVPHLSPCFSVVFCESSFESLEDRLLEGAPARGTKGKGDLLNFEAQTAALEELTLLVATSKEVKSLATQSLALLEFIVRELQLL